MNNPLLNSFVELLGFDTEELKEATREQKQIFENNTHNLHVGNVWLLPGLIITKNIRSWEYYGGFEYINDSQKHKIRINGEEFAAYEGDRVDEFLELLEE